MGNEYKPLELKLDNEKFKILQEYTEIEERTINLNELGVNKFHEMIVNEIIMKIVKIPDVDTEGNILPGVMVQRNNVILRNDKDVISTFAGSISRFIFQLIISMGYGKITDKGFIKVTGLDLKIRITRKVAKNKNFYRCKLLENNSKKIFLLPLGKSDIKDFMLEMTDIQLIEEGD